MQLTLSLSVSFLFASMVLVVSRPASAVLIGPSGEPGFSSEHSVLSSNGSLFWSIAPLEPLAHSREAGPWEKSLFNSDGTTGPVADDDPNSATPTLFAILETIRVDSESIPWTDWHENIMTPGWFFTPDDPLISLNSPMGTSENINASTTIVNMGGMLWFFFDDAIPPGYELMITKSIQFLGEDSTPGNGDIYDGGPVIIRQHASVPEPSPFALLVIVSCVVGLLRYRCHSSFSGLKSLATRLR